MPDAPLLEVNMTHEAFVDSTGELARMDRYLHDLAWGLLLTLTGVIWLFPDSKVPPGTWLFGVAAILIGVNLVRRLNHIRVSALSMILGVIALIAALGEAWRTDLHLLPVCLIIIGLSLVAKPMLGKPA